MPDIDATSHGQLLLHQFPASIPGHVSRQLRVRGDTTDLRVVEKACLLISIDEQPENAATPSNAIVESTLGNLQTQIQDLTQQVVVALATRSTQQQSQQPAV